MLKDLPVGHSWTSEYIGTLDQFYHYDDYWEKYNNRAKRIVKSLAGRTAQEAKNKGC